MTEQKKFLEGTEQYNTEISWDDALAQNGEFMKFEEGKRVKIAIQNYRIISVEKADFNDKTQMVIQPQFEADVIMENGEKCSKRLSILSKRFMAAVRPFLEGKPSGDIFYISVKKIGKDNATNYDVEDFDPAK